jgi:hypothetical protein
VASALCLKNILHKKYIMEELGFPLQEIPLFIDNTAVKFMASEWKVTENTKHINTRYHFLRSHVMRGTIAIYYVDSEENIADLGTKPLAQQAHDYLMSKIMDGTPRHCSRYKMNVIKKRAEKRSRQVMTDNVDD